MTDQQTTSEISEPWKKEFFALRKKNTMKDIKMHMAEFVHEILVEHILKDIPMA